MKILITGIEKTVTDWDENEGAGTESWIAQSEDHQGIFPNLKSALDRVEKKFGFPGPSAEWLILDDGRIISSRVEDKHGSAVSPSQRESLKPLYLADYEIYLDFDEETHTPSTKEMEKELKLSLI